jgi:hypothetical protein
VINYQIKELEKKINQLTLLKDKGREIQVKNNNEQQQKVEPKV